jgi:ATP-dependent DNA helicase RecQ
VGELPVEVESELSIEEVEKRKAILKEWRDRKSDEIGKPKFFVLQNKTIKELASKTPETVEDLQSIYGIGEAKAEQYGDELLSLF